MKYFNYQLFLNLTYNKQDAAKDDRASFLLII